MVTNSRKTESPGPLRLLNPPRPVQVKLNDADRPMAITLKGKALKIIKIDEIWEVDTEWWRPRGISRRYFRVTTEGDRDVTIFWDLGQGGWYRQNV